MFYMRRIRRFIVWLLVVYALIYFVGFLCVRSNWGKGLVADYISSKTGCFVKLERASLSMNFKINVFDLTVFADKDMTVQLFAAPTLKYGWGTLDARRIKVLADFDESDRPFSSSLHKFASEEDFYKVEKLNAFSLSLFEHLDDVNLYDISIVLKVNGKTENHFLTKFIKKPLDLPDEDDVFYFVLGDNLRWITTSHGKIISTINNQQSVEAEGNDPTINNQQPTEAEENDPTINNQQSIEAEENDPAINNQQPIEAEENNQQSTANNQQSTEVKEEAEENNQQLTANNQQPTEIKEDVKVEDSVEAKAEVTPVENK